MYTPKVGDSVVARRKIKPKNRPFMICGPVVNCFDDCCVIVTNEGTEIEGTFVLRFDQYDFQFLHLTKDSYGNYNE